MYMPTPCSGRDIYSELLAAIRADSLTTYQLVVSFREQISDLVNMRDAYGWTPLHHAIKHASPDIVRLLLSHGADPNLMNHGMTPLHYATMYNDRDGYIRNRCVLVHFGADINILNPSGHTADEMLQILLHDDDADLPPDEAGSGDDEDVVMDILNNNSDDEDDDESENEDSIRGDEVYDDSSEDENREDDDDDMSGSGVVGSNSSSSPSSSSANTNYGNPSCKRIYRGQGSNSNGPSDNTENSDVSEEFISSTVVEESDNANATLSDPFVELEKRVPFTGATAAVLSVS